MIRLSYEPDAPDGDIAVIENAIDRYNMDTVQDWQFIPVNIFLRDNHHGLQGGIVGGIWGRWLHIQFLWVHEHYRKRGYGAQLLAAAEHEARKQNCLGIYLETFDFQARDFYIKYGFSIVAELPHFPPGHSHYIMQKILTSGTESGINPDST